MTMDQHTPGKVHWEIWDEVYADGYIDRLVQEGGRVILRHKSIRPMDPQDRRRIAACWNACEEAGIPTDALEAGVVRDLIEAAARYLAATTRESDDDPNCWADEEFAEAWLCEVLAKVRGEA